MNKKEEGKSITVYELFGLSNNNYKINNDKINKKRNVSESKKKFVAASQKWNCNMCGNILDASYEIDHKQPLYKGGGNDIGQSSSIM